MSRSHVTQALDAELARTSPVTNTITGMSERAEDAAFAAGSALLFMAANTAVPVAGGVAAAVTVCELQRARKPPTATASTAGVATSTNGKPHVLEAVEEELRCRTLTVPFDSVEATSEGVKAWNAWLPWDELYDGKHVLLPEGMPHPREAGFRKTYLAKSVGQVNDWVRRLDGGSRLHVHEFRGNGLPALDGPRGDGSASTFEVHRDHLDPSRDPVTASIHWLSETDEGVATTLAGLTFFAVFWGLKGALLASVVEGT